MNTLKVDIAIMGAGIVGLSLAKALAPHFSIAIIDKVDPCSCLTTDTYDSRVYALSHASINLLHNLGCSFKEGVLGPMMSMEIYDSSSGCPSPLSFSAFEHQIPNLGVIVQEKDIKMALLEAKNKDDILDDVCEPHYFYGQETITIDPLGIIDTKDSRIHAKLIVGADGANSLVRKSLFKEIGIKSHSYEQIAIVANVRASIPHAQKARQYFDETGPIAFLPMHEKDLYSIVWSCDTSLATSLLQMNEHEFLAQLQSASHFMLGQFTLVTPRKSFPLECVSLSSFIVDKAVLIGDAAHRFHPLAGQGLNAGLTDVAYLVDELLKIKSRSRDIGLKENLLSFNLSAHAYNQRLIMMMSLFKQGFGSNMSLVQRLRNHALAWVEKSHRLKSFFVQEALGKHSNATLHRPNQ